MVDKLASHERQYINNRKKGKRFYEAAPLEVYVWKIKTGGESFEILNGKDVSLRKNGMYVPLSFTQSEKQLFK
jgi:hypothetical protein